MLWGNPENKCILYLWHHTFISILIFLYLYITYLWVYHLSVYLSIYLSTYHWRINTTQNNNLLEVREYAFKQTFQRMNKQEKLSLFRFKLVVWEIK